MQCQCVVDSTTQTRPVESSSYLQYKCRAWWKAYGERPIKFTCSDHFHRTPKDNACCGEKGDSHKGAQEVMVVNVRRDTVPDTINIDNCTVRLLVRRHDAPSHESLSQSSKNWWHGLHRLLNQDAWTETRDGSGLHYCTEHPSNATSVMSTGWCNVPLSSKRCSTSS